MTESNNQINEEQVYNLIEEEMKDTLVVKFPQTEVNKQIKDCIAKRYKTWENESYLYVSTEAGKKQFFDVAVTPQLKKFETVINSGNAACIDLVKTPKYFLDAVREMYPFSWEENGKLNVGTEKMWKKNLKEKEDEKNQHQKFLASFMNGLGEAMGRGKIDEEPVDEEKDEEESSSDPEIDQTKEIDPTIKQEIIDDQIKNIKKKLNENGSVIISKTLPSFVVEAIINGPFDKVVEYDDEYRIFTQQAYDKLCSDNAKQTSFFDNLEKNGFTVCSN